MDKALSFLGLSRRAGRLLTGEEGVAGAARSGEAVLLMTACDTADNTRKRAVNLSKWYRIQYVALPWDKDTLGELLDKRVCAIMALTDKGLAAAFLEKLAAAYPEYEPAAEAFRAGRTAKRRQRQ